LRQFFIAYLMSGKQYVSMPSQAVDELWHAFILYTREYQSFCRRAFGTFLHHAPAATLGGQRKSNEGLRRVWWYCCKYENIDPVNPTRLPLLFALDVKLNIPNGFRYHPQCEALRDKARAHAADTGSGGATAIHCGGDFSDPNYDGTTAGFGDSSSGDGGGGDAGSGCGGGGCGGGGGD
jgi:hypothetical protein